jgi:hypothetical protein
MSMVSPYSSVEDLVCFHPGTCRLHQLNIDKLSHIGIFQQKCTKQCMKCCCVIAVALCMNYVVSIFILTVSFFQS